MVLQRFFRRAINTALLRRLENRSVRSVTVTDLVAALYLAATKCPWRCLSAMKSPPPGALTHSTTLTRHRHMSNQPLKRRKKATTAVESKHRNTDVRHQVQMIADRVSAMGDLRRKVETFQEEHGQLKRPRKKRA